MGISQEVKVDQEAISKHIDDIANSSPLMRKCFGIGVEGGRPLELLDHFAGLAMQAMMNAPIGKFSHKSTDEIAIGAYRAADEMIKARGE